MMNKKWTKAELNQLYNVEGKTLQEIGDLGGGVSREWIRQVMERFGLVRGFNCSEKMRGPRPYYKSLEDYFKHPKDRADISSTTLHKLLRGLRCSECGTARNVHLHHIVYPATSMNDLQILCASCHSMKHRGNMTYLRQIDIYNQYMRGQTAKSLAEEYEVSRILIYQILRKVRNGSGSLKDVNHLGRLSRNPTGVSR